METPVSAGAPDEGELEEAAPVEQSTEAKPKETLAPKPVTAEDLASFEQRIIARTQSMVDKSRNTVFASIRPEIDGIQKTVAALKELGVEVPQQAVDQLSQRKLMEALSGPSEPAEPSPAEDATDELTSGIAAAGVAIMAEYGVKIVDGDPEMSLVRLDTNSPSVFLESLKAASQAKARRLGLIAPEQPAEETPEPPAPRRPIRKGPTVKRAPGDMGAADFFKQAYSKTPR